MDQGSPLLSAGSSKRSDDPDFRRWLEMLPVAAYTCDRTGLLTFFNRQAVELWGRAPDLNNPRDRFCGSLRLLCADGSEMPREQGWMARTLAENQPFAAREMILERPDGSQRIALAHTTPLYDENGRLAGAVNVLIDVTAQQRAEDGLRRSERRLHTLVEHAPYAFFLVDPEMKIVDVNRQACESLGYSRDELLAMTVPEIDRDVRREHLDQTWEETPTGRPFTVYGRHCRKDGSSFPVEVRLSRFRMDSQRYCLALVRDISERDRILEELKRSKLLFRQLADALPQLVWIALPDGSVELLNRRVEEYSGRSESELNGWGWQQIAHANDLPEALRRITEALRTGEPLDMEFRLRRYDGEYRWYVARAVSYRDEAGAIQRWFGIATDVHDLKQAQEALRASEERFQQFMNNSPALAWMVDADDRFVYLNSAYTKLCGLTTEIALNCDMRELFPDEVVQVFLENNRRVRESGRPLEIVESGPKADGTEGHLLVVKFPIAAGDGRMMVGGVGVDVSGHRRLEEQLRVAQKMEAIGRLAGGIAHDFNNLMTVITGYSHLLLAELPPGDSRHESVAAIRDAGERAASLTRQLLAFSRRQVLKSVVLDLNEVVMQAEKMFRRLIGEDIILDVRLASQPSHIKADRSQIEQVLMNLVVNARDAMPQGGRLTIQTLGVELDESRAAQYEDLRPGSYVQMSICDTGQGIVEALQTHLFEPFFTTKEVGQGTGLGLAVVHGIVKQSGGHIRVSSTVGVGTSFEILLPVASAGASAASTRPPKLGPGGDETILVVDDEAAVLKIARIILEGLGYRVLEARGGVEALEVAERHTGRIDLLLTDVVMPEVDGRQLAQSLGARRREMRVVFMSGYTDDEIIQRGGPFPSSQLLQKPFSPPTLAHRIRAALDRPVAS